MPRPDAARLSIEFYRFHLEVPPRFGDVDLFRHLNNVALARLYEEGRVRFTDGLRLRDVLEPEHGCVVGEINIRYLIEGRYPEAVTAAAAVLRVGRSSFTVAQALFQLGRCIGVADATLVHVNRREGGSRPLPEPAVALLRQNASPLASTGGVQLPDNDR